MTLRRASLLAPLALALLVLAGCEPVITEQSGSQVEPGGPVQVVTKLCVASDETDDGIDNDTCRDENLAEVRIQFLAGYLVPEGTEANSVRLEGAVAGSLSPSERGALLLESQKPAPEGRRWVAFSSGLIDEIDEDGPNESRVIASVQPPAGSDSSARFAYDVMHVIRFLEEDDANVDGFSCTNSECSFVESLPGVETADQIPVRDAALLGDQEVSAPAGTAAAIPFTLRYAGDTPAGDVALSATTSVPGASAAPDPATVSLDASGDTPVGVHVEVPAGTAPGTYEVGLELSLPGGAVRSATGRLIVPVPPPPPTPPVVEPAAPELGTVAIRSHSIRTVLREGLRLRQSVSGPGTIAWSLAKGHSAKKVRTVEKAGDQFLRLRLSKKGRKRLKARKRATLVLKTTLTDTLGRSTAKRTRILLTR